MTGETVFMSLSWLPYEETQRDRKPELAVETEFPLIKATDFRWATPIRKPANSRERTHRIGSVALTSSNDHQALSRELARQPWLPNPFSSVVFESRLEEDHILVLDRDPAVSWIVSQPFRVTGADKDGVVFSHTPDLLAIRNGATMMIDVKPLDKVSDPDVQKRRSLMQLLCRELSWTYSIGSELSGTYRTNLRYLRRYRRRPASFTEAGKVLDRVIRATESTRTQPVTIAGLTESCGGWGETVPTILHLMWSGQLLFDWDKPISERTVLRRSADPAIGASA